MWNVTRDTVVLIYPEEWQEIRDRRHPHPNCQSSHHHLPNGLYDHHHGRYPKMDSLSILSNVWLLVVLVQSQLVRVGHQASIRPLISWQPGGYLSLVLFDMPTELLLHVRLSDWSFIWHWGNWWRTTPRVRWWRLVKTVEGRDPRRYIDRTTCDSTWGKK